MKFEKAKRSKTFLKLAITGPSGSGKTYSALRLARGFVGESGKIAFIDTENGSASNYDSLTDFDVINMEPPYTHNKYIDGINMAVKEGYDFLVIDSASHLWQWVLDEKGKLDDQTGASKSFQNWNKAGGWLKEAMNTILQSPIHIMFCMRSKTEYVLEKNEKGYTVPRKIGMCPVMRDGIEYEFTIVFDVSFNHYTTSGKDRTNLFVDQVFQITEETGRLIKNWHENAPDAKVKATQDTDEKSELVEKLISLTGKTESDVHATIFKHFSVDSIDAVVVGGLRKMVEAVERKYQKKGDASNA